MSNHRAHIQVFADTKIHSRKFSEYL